MGKENYLHFSKFDLYNFQLSLVVLETKKGMNAGK